MRPSLGKLFLFPLLALTLNAFGAQEELSGSFCVQTFNVYATAYAPQIQNRLERIGEELLKSPCDAVQLQELWRTEDFELMRNKLEQGHQALLFADHLRSDNGMIGLASAFSGSVLNAYSELFRVNNEKGPLDWVREWAGVRKGLTALEVRFDHSPALLFLNLHTHPMSQSVRIAQILQLVEFNFFRSLRGPILPIVLTGDLNASPDSLELELLKNVLRLQDSFSDSHAGNYGSTCTYCSDNSLSWTFKDRVIDFTLYRSSPDIALEVIDSEVNLKGDEQSGPLSDHFGLRSHLGWKVRFPEFLAADDPEVQKRRQQAQESLERAYRLLMQESSTTLLEAAELSLELQRRFSQDLPEKVDRLFRLKQ